MKTIATAAAVLMLSAPAWADEPERKSTPVEAPIVLSEVEMGGITAGTGFGTFSIKKRDTRIRRATYDTTPEDYRSKWSLPN